MEKKNGKNEKKNKWGSCQSSSPQSSNCLQDRCFYVSKQKFTEKQSIRYNAGQPIEIKELIICRLEHATERQMDCYRFQWTILNDNKVHVQFENVCAFKVSFVV